MGLLRVSAKAQQQHGLDHQSRRRSRRKHIEGFLKCTNIVSDQTTD
jgi:hypothetical protein